MTVEEAVFSWVAADSGVTALIGSPPRLYPGRLPQNPTLPAVSYQRISGTRESAMGDDTGVARARIQFSAFHAQYSTAKGVKEALRGALQRFRGTVSGVEIQDVFLEDDRDEYDDSTELHQHMLDVQVIYTEA